MSKLIAFLENRRKIRGMVHGIQKASLKAVIEGYYRRFVESAEFVQDSGGNWVVEVRFFGESDLVRLELGDNEYSSSVHGLAASG